MKHLEKYGFYYLLLIIIIFIVYINWNNWFGTKSISTSTNTSGRIIRGIKSTGRFAHCDCPIGEVGISFSDWLSGGCKALGCFRA